MKMVLRSHAKNGWMTRDLLWPGEIPDVLSNTQQQLQQVGGPETLITSLSNLPRDVTIPDYILESNVFSIKWQLGGGTGTGLTDTELSLSIHTY